MENPTNFVDAIRKDLSERDPRTYAIIGAAIEVHKHLGCGFLESVYQEALAIELGLREIPFRREVRLPVSYKVQVLVTSFCADFICFDSLVLELIAIAPMNWSEEAQLINSVKATQFRLGLVLILESKSIEEI